MPDLYVCHVLKGAVKQPLTEELKVSWVYLIGRAFPCSRASFSSLSSPMETDRLTTRIHTCDAAQRCGGASRISVSDTTMRLSWYTWTCVSVERCVLMLIPQSAAMIKVVTSQRSPVSEVGTHVAQTGWTVTRSKHTGEKPMPPSQ